MNKNSLLALGLLAALPFAASATDGLSYNYVEGGYVNTDAKGGDADGWKVDAGAGAGFDIHAGSAAGAAGAGDGVAVCETDESSNGFSSMETSGDDGQ